MRKLFIAVIVGLLTSGTSLAQMDGGMGGGVQQNGAGCWGTGGGVRAVARKAEA